MIVRLPSARKIPPPTRGCVLGADVDGLGESWDEGERAREWIGFRMSFDFGSAGSIISIGTLRMILCERALLGTCKSLDRDAERTGGIEIGSR